MDIEQSFHGVLPYLPSHVEVFWYKGYSLFLNGSHCLVEIETPSRVFQFITTSKLFDTFSLKDEGEDYNYNGIGIVEDTPPTCKVDKKYYKHGELDFIFGSEDITERRN